MKRIITIAMVMALAVMLIPGAVLADDPTELNMNWSGGGSVGATFTAGNDATHSFFAGGSTIAGTFTATDSNDNPYAYQVDTTSSYLTSSVGEGLSWYQTDRNDSKTSMYGNAGQMSYSYIEAWGGTAEMATGSSTNYAAMKDCTYNKTKTTSGKNFEANASNYTLQKWVGQSGNPGVPTGNWASFSAMGNGTALIDCMSSEASGNWPLKLGWGCGCYTNADAAFTGSGIFQVDAVGTNSTVTPIANASGTEAPGAWTVPGDGTFGSCTYSVVATYAGNFSVGNYSVKVD